MFIEKYFEFFISFKNLLNSKVEKNPKYFFMTYSL